MAVTQVVAGRDSTLKGQTTESMVSARRGWRTSVLDYEAQRPWTGRHFGQLT